MESSPSLSVPNNYHINQR
uniref:Uncharacterized protein n=1 Tax=Arundo donax TaxID=35708 RepID=A0A0A9A6V9_ARUDO